MTERKAPTGKFRVLGVDTFDGTDWVHGDFDTKDQALSAARMMTAGKQMLKAHAYDETGRHIGESGSF